MVREAQRAREDAHIEDAMEAGHGENVHDPSLEGHAEVVVFGIPVADMELATKLRRVMISAMVLAVIVFVGGVFNMIESDYRAGDVESVVHCANVSGLTLSAYDVEQYEEAQNDAWSTKAQPVIGIVITVAIPVLGACRPRRCNTGCNVVRP